LNGGGDGTGTTPSSNGAAGAGTGPTGAGARTWGASAAALGLPAGSAIDYAGLTVAQVQKLPQYNNMIASGVPPGIANSIIKATPPSLGDPLDPVIDIAGTEIQPSDPRFASAVENITKDADHLFRAPGQIDTKALRGFLKKAGPVIGIAIMGLKVAGLDELGEKNRVGGLMRDALMIYGGGAGMTIAGAMTALPYIGMGLEKTLIPVVSKSFGKLFGALNLGGSSAAGTTVDSTIIDPQNFDPQVMNEILLEVDSNPDFLGIGRPVTREQIMNGEIAIPDSFLQQLASGHELSLDDARGDAQRMAKGEGGMDVGYTRHNLATGGGTLAPDQLNRVDALAANAGITDPGQLNIIKSEIKTAGDLAAFQRDPAAWLRSRGMLGRTGRLAGG